MIVKKKKCVSCGDEFEPRNIGNTTIRTKRCLACIGIQNLSKIKQDKVKKKKIKLMTTQDWLKIAQTHFNHYIRLRDKGNPCVSCGNEIKGVTHASHYLSSGGHSSTRFNEDNTNSCCFKCNVMLSSNAIEYRRRLIEKIGIERVEHIEKLSQEHKRWELSEIQEIIRIYKEKVKLLK